MIILPGATAPNGAAEACRKLRELKSEERVCALLVFGEGSQPDKIATMAEIRVDSDPSRMVVRIPDPSVLAGDPELRFLAQLAESGVAAVALTLKFQVSSRLQAEKAAKIAALEEAFAKAQMGEL